MNVREIPKPIRLRLFERAQQWPSDLTSQIRKMQRQFDDLISARTERNQSLTVEKMRRSWFRHYIHTALVDQHTVETVRVTVDKAERELNQMITMQRASDGLPEEVSSILETVLRAHTNFVLIGKEQREDARTTEDYRHCEIVFQASFIALTDALADFCGGSDVNFAQMQQSAQVELMLYEIEDAYAERQKINDLFEDSDEELAEID